MALHFPMFFKAGEMHYRLSGMAIGTDMKIGMALILLGIAATAYGLVPRGSDTVERAARIEVQALDDAPFQRNHVTLLLVMAAAVTIDVMKPTTLVFVIPGMSEEYGLKSRLTPNGDVPVAWFPFLASPA